MKTTIEYKVEFKHPIYTDGILTAHMDDLDNKELTKKEVLKRFYDFKTSYIDNINVENFKQATDIIVLKIIKTKKIIKL